MTSGMNSTEFIEQNDVFVSGADGVNTYRIPALIAGAGGELLAFCEARKKSAADAGPTDLVLKRSMDNGQTWGAMLIVLRGIGDEAIMNPCPVFDGKNLIMLCINAHKTARGHHRQLLLRSPDAGNTWSEPEDITEAVAHGVDTFITGPGVGIRAHDGRLIVPGYSGVYADDASRLDTRSRVLFSDNGGRSWSLGAAVDYAFSNESQVLELASGELLLNFRIQKVAERHPGCRGMAISRDGGETWLPSTLAKNLNDVICQAGWMRVPSSKSTEPGWLVFSNPDSAPGPHSAGRARMTVKISSDEGATWPVKRLLHPGPSAYSCPALLSDGTLGVLYECGENKYYERIKFARASIL